MTYVAYGYNTLHVYVESETKPECYRKMLEMYEDDGDRVYSEPIVVAKVVKS